MSIVNLQPSPKHRSGRGGNVCYSSLDALQEVRLTGRLLGITRVGITGSGSRPEMKTLRDSIPFLSTPQKHVMIAVFKMERLIERLEETMGVTDWAVA